MNFDKQGLVRELWSQDPEIHRLLKKAENLHEAREFLFNYLNDLESHYFNILSVRSLVTRHIIERNNAKECIRVFKNIIRTENEKQCRFSALKLLWRIARANDGALQDAGEGFLCEFIALVKGINSRSAIASKHFKHLGDSEGKNPTQRSKHLDAYARWLYEQFSRFSDGLDPGVAARQIKVKKEILQVLGGTSSDWYDYRWHLKNVFKDAESIRHIVKLEPDELQGLARAGEYGIPVQITPYYLSLFNKKGRCELDRGVRAHVIPSVTYCENIRHSKESGDDMDFMGEKATSPVAGITRRYPQIVILKPYDSCPQICVYCQRNWEIKDIGSAQVSREIVTRAIAWIRRNTNLREVLVTGGDPLTLSNSYLDWLIGELAGMRHIERIRIGTRALVTVPFRINEGFVELLKKYHKPGKRELAIMTHVEYPLEITPELVDAVKGIRSAGVSVYNQQVFTYYTSKRYQTAYLRWLLKLSGIDPYYTFNTKGKNETTDFRVPIARLEQEHKEEARLMPGLARTDYPVFNVPRLGKSYLVAWQDHEPTMVLADGRRVYRFYPWESRLTFSSDYLYTDVSIYDYLKRLQKDRENADEYSSIWYYF
ncbi:MAG: KamA family radical SAM protein [Chitinispirillaceae bacterium]|nr:KamA family radical SAM protein [Chitinispirillaceae bacterium]